MEKKTVIAINEVDYGSTGNICRSVLSELQTKGYDVYFACNDVRKNDDTIYKIHKSKVGYLLNKIICRFGATDGFHSKHATKKLIKFIESKNPQYLFLHNLHGGYVSLPLILSYIKNHDVKVIWTLHDCWLFTGKCSHFLYAKCDKWKTECHHCPCLKEHPRSYMFDKSRKLFKLKKQLFQNLENKITFVTPSKWLKDLMQFSYLKSYEILTINNGIDLNEKTMICSEKLPQNLNIETKLFFSAAMPMNERKGINFINKLAEELDPNKYLFLVAGLDRKRCKLNKNIVDLGDIRSREEMNYFYSISTAFLNPTLEDNFPTVNIESLLMKTPVITFNAGGSPETLIEETGSKVVSYVSYDELKNAVLNCNPTKQQKEACYKQAMNYSKEIMINKYIKLF